MPKTGYDPKLREQPERRAAKALQKATGVKYTTALREVMADPCVCDHGQYMHEVVNFCNGCTCTAYIKKEAK